MLEIVARGGKLPARSPERRSFRAVRRAVISASRFKVDLLVITGNIYPLYFWEGGREVGNPVLSLG